VVLLRKIGLEKTKLGKRLYTESESEVDPKIRPSYSVFNTILRHV